MDSLNAFSGTYNEFLVHKAMQQHNPISGTFELLPNCNMRCRMCYIQHSPDRDALQPAEFWIETYRQAIEAGMLFALLTGGEALIYPEFERLYEELTRFPAYLCINTNGTLLNRERVKWLAKNPPRRLNISLYGASDETYAKLCGNPNGFSQVLQAFELLKEYDIPFKVHGVLVPENEKDYRGILDTCNRYKVHLSMSNYMFPAYRKELESITAEGRFTPEEMARMTFRYMADHFHGAEEKYRMQIAKYCEAMEQPEIYSLYDNDRVACRGGVCTFWVDWHGNISGCGVHNQGKISLKEIPFAEAWRQTVDYTNRVRISEQCKKCKYRCICPVCPAAGFCETGVVHGTPSYLCQYCEAYAQILFEERRRLFG